MSVHTDEHLAHWGEQFVASGLRAVMTFDHFMSLPVGLRARRVARSTFAAAIQERIEREIPDAGLRDSALVDPFHHGKRERRRPWYYRLRNHLRGRR